MPSQSVIRRYVENSYYHVFNRGVEKRLIFLEETDYLQFLYYLFVYLAPLPQVLASYPKLKANLQRNNLYTKTELNAYCLMPNHFHLLIRQYEKNGVEKLMKQLANAYTGYFNQKYNRVGPLFQGRYKAKLIEHDDYLMYLSAYIHRNPLPLLANNRKLQDYRWSSYQLYQQKDQQGWINYKPILAFFSQSHQTLSYQAFVERSDLTLPSNYLFDE